MPYLDFLQIKINELNEQEIEYFKNPTEVFEIMEPTIKEELLAMCILELRDLIVSQLPHLKGQHDAIGEMQKKIDSLESQIFKLQRTKDAR